MLARTRFSAAVLALLALAFMAAPAAGHAAGAFKVSGPPQDFLTGILGGRPPVNIYTFTNEGTVALPLEIADPQTTSLGGGYVSRGPSPEPCSDVLGPGASCKVDITFLAFDTDPLEALWPVSLGGESRLIHLRGAAQAPHLRWSGDEPGFGAVAVDGEVTRTLTLHNPNRAMEAHVKKIAIAGDAHAFELLGTDCTDRWLAPEGTCTARVRFWPSRVGGHNATLVASTPGPDSRHPGFEYKARLTGSAHNAKFEASASALAFGPVALGAHAVRTVTVKNVGVGSGRVLAAFSGPAAHEFRLAHDGCHAELGEGASCEFKVAFYPTAAGHRHASLFLLGGGGHHLTVALEGTGS